MFFSSWLRKQVAKPRTSRRATSTFRPRLEVLEGRDVPSTLTVTNNLDNGSVGSLGYEIGHAKKGDTIVFAPSLDGQTITLSGSELDITKSVTIRGPGAGLLTINGGADPANNLNPTWFRVFAVEKNANVTLSGLTITGGGGTAYGDPYYFPRPYDNDGGGILNLGTLTVSACTVSGNYVNPVDGNSFGGGIYNAGTLTVSNSTVANNSVGPDPASDVWGSPTGDGGGIYNAGTLTITGSTISSNFAYSDGGGIYNAGTAKVNGCTLSSNGALSLGGAIYNAGTPAALTVIDSIFSGNRIEDWTANIYGAYTDGGGNTFS